MFSLVAFILVALVVGIIAKALVPARDPDLGITMLLGLAAQILVWLASRAFGGYGFAQPWSFFLSIAAAAALLFLYRETGLDQIRAERKPDAARPAGAEPIERPHHQQAESIWLRIALAPVWATLGGVMLGTTGFLIGFFGPIHFQPWANQGPMLGLFVTGPGGVLLGGLIGGGLKLAKPEWPMRWRVWFLNAANVAYGLFVFALVADRSWWR
jgi:uncharacterized membrane protein YeaQ/YmgE (transglycosylase-associated protein family)